MEKSISVIVPAYNESDSLRGVVKGVRAAMENSAIDYEVILVNDCSTDNTGAIADDLARQWDNVRVLHNKTNMNFGYSFLRGVQESKKNYVCEFPGDDDVLHDSLKDILISVGEADVILAYHDNYEARVWLRRIISKLFVRLMNILFGLRIRYYNGPCVFPADRLRKLKVKNHGFACIAEMVIRLLKSPDCRTTFKEVPMRIRQEKKGYNLRVFRLKNVVSVVGTVFLLFWEIRIFAKFKHRCCATQG